MISDHSNYAQLINKSGKQRMLSQRIVLLAVQYKSSNKDDIVASIAEIKKNHKFLINRKLSKNLQSIYYKSPENLDKLLTDFIHLTESYILYEDEKNLIKLIAMQDSILKLFDKVVIEIEEESKEFSENMIIIELIVILLIAILLYLESIYIFNPMLKKIEKKMGKIFG